MPRHSNSYACGMDIPEVAFDKRCRRSSHRPMGGTKVQKHPGKQSLDLERGVHLSSIDEHEFWYESDDQEVSDQTTASPEAEEEAEEDDFDESGWDFVAEPVREEAREEWPSLQGNSALDALETMSMASDLTLCSWVDVADEESEVVSPQAAPTWAARLGTSTAPRPSKAALPWAHRRPRARNASIVPEDHDDIEDAADVAALRSWNKWQKSSRNTKAMQKTAEKIHRRFEQSRRAKGDEL
ncbi:unnamed protein product [Symbiodinium sp. KB8]|nr:unnamed protein product [Symbiodinium sp. KB8]